MRYFETRYGAGVGQEQVPIKPEHEPLWAALFETEDLEFYFDQNTPDTAVPVIDTAIHTLNHSPDDVRHLIPAGEKGTLVRTRRTLEQMRSTLVTFEDATISGLLED